jgi:hypothetical protein
VAIRFLPERVTTLAHCKAREDTVKRDGIPGKTVGKLAWQNIGVSAIQYIGVFRISIAHPK